MSTAQLGTKLIEIDTLILHTLEDKFQPLLRAQKSFSCSPGPFFGQILGVKTFFSGLKAGLPTRPLVAGLNAVAPLIPTIYIQNVHSGNLRPLSLSVHSYRFTPLTCTGDFPFADWCLSAILRSRPFKGKAHTETNGVGAHFQAALELSVNLCFREDSGRGSERVNQILYLASVNLPRDLVKSHQGKKLSGLYIVLTSPQPVTQPFCSARLLLNKPGFTHEDAVQRSRDVGIDYPGEHRGMDFYCAARIKCQVMTTLSPRTEGDTKDKHRAILVAAIQSRRGASVTPGSEAFRNPLPGRTALVVKLKSDTRHIEMANGHRADKTRRRDRGSIGLGEEACKDSATRQYVGRRRMDHGGSQNSGYPSTALIHDGYSFGVSTTSTNNVDDKYKAGFPPRSYITIDMSTRAPSQSTLQDFTKRARIYVACVNCRKRKVRCITIDNCEETPCKRCTEKGLLCSYLAVCEERDNPAQNPPPPSQRWNQGPRSSSSARSAAYGRQKPSQYPPIHGQPPSQSANSRFNPSPSFVPNATPNFYSNQLQSQPPVPTNPAHGYGTNTYRNPTQITHYPSPGMPYQSSLTAGFNPNYDSSNFYVPDPGYDVQFGFVLLTKPAKKTQWLNSLLF
ncbi:hypothetical protein DFH06DRAFT_1429284 [Mycena polygramma]|nr:hypothetical protein DFH06DRAFT_1429284 [Mycena polygramma]